MSNFKLTIQYDGGRYKGWQRLGNGENTVQEKIEKVLTEMLGEDIEITGCSRTDAGVHALGQIANFKTNKKLTKSEVKNYLNRYLPKDICVKDVNIAAERFHAQYNAEEKTYLYKIWNKDYTNPFLRNYSMHVDKKLNIKEMKKASQYFIGEHDFTAFSNAKSKKKSMVREIYSIDIEEKEGLVQIRVCGNGFLHNMVRRIVGTLVKVGLDEVATENIPKIITSKERNLAGYIADANGLYLEKIKY
ncbi:MAG: tRNA pseudouridine(38-40) synthase TruA [Clostridiales bacterium]|nr:tRNA pseudouridine(38-40) synthase TruA [Clostridiales bacterium]